MKNQLLILICSFLITSCNNQVDKTEKVEKTLETVERTPETGEEWFNRAMAEPNTQLQIMYYTNAIKYGSDTFPNYCSAINNRAIAKKKLQDFRGALDDFNLCLNSCPFLTPSYSFRGECKMHLNDFKGAIKDFNAVIKSDVQDFFKASAFMNKGTCLYHLGKKEEACKDWSTAGQLGSVGAYDYIKQYCQ